MDVKSTRHLALATVSLLGLALAAGCSADSGGTDENASPVPLVSTNDLPAAEPGEIHLFGLNDLHGNLEPPEGSNGVVSGYPAGGAAYLATHLAKLRAAYPASAILSAGDNISASPLVSSLFHDEPTVELLNSLGVAASSVGNHEFDHGVLELERIQKGGCAPDGCSPGAPFTGAAFPYLAANVTGGDGQLPPGLRPWTIIDVGGHKVGVVGVVTPDTASVVIPEGIRGFTFGDEVDAINKNVPALKAAGAETVVALMHDGGVQHAPKGTPVDYNGCADITPEVTNFAKRTDPAVQVLITGHTHQPYVCNIDGKVVTQAFSYGRLITDITLRFGEAGAVTAKAVNRLVTKDVPTDPATTKLVDFYVAQANPRANRVVGTIAGDLTHTPSASGESPLGDVIADAMLAATAAPNPGGAVAAVTNAGGVRADLIAKAKPGKQEGQVTYSEIHTVAPFSNQVITMSLTGQQIISMLEQQWLNITREPGVLSVAGLEYTYIDAAPKGHKVIADSVRIAGQPLNPVALYRISTNNFVASGGDGFTVFQHGTDRVVGPADLDMLEAYFRNHTGPGATAGDTGPVPVAAPANRITKR